MLDTLSTAWDPSSDIHNGLFLGQNLEVGSPPSGQYIRILNYSLLN